MEAPPPGQLSARPVLWAERLGLFDAAWLALRAAATGEEVRYDEHRASVHGLRLAGPFGFTPARLTLARAGENGAPLNDRRESFLEAALEKFARGRLAERPARLRSAFRAYFAGKLVARATFLVMAEAAAKAMPEREHRYFIVSHPANILLREVFGGRLVERPALTEALRQLAAPLVLIARAAWAGLTRPAVRSNLTGKPAIWVEYYPDDIGGYISRAFWKDRVDRDRWDLAFCVDHAETPCDDATIRRIEDFGMRWIDARRPWRLAGLSAGEALALAGLLLRPGLPWWVRAFEVHYEATTAVWAAVFKRHRVRLLTQHLELEWKPVAQAEALERAGGAMFGLHWSDFPFLTEPTHPTPEHVFFVWGATNKRWLEGKGHATRHILPCGLWLPSNPCKTAEIKSRLGPSDFTLAVFDSSYSYDIFYSAEMLAAFLDEILSLLESRPAWKAVFKPKNALLYETLPGGPALMGRLRALEAAGRVLILERFVSPIDAALACDLSVCFGFNSAGVVAGARGARAVHWDAAGWTRHPLRAEPGQRVVYPSLTALRKAIETAPDDTAIGDFSRWRRLSDHFGDDNAAERVGTWVEEAMQFGVDEASDRYMKRHRVGADFIAPGRWWRD